MPIDAIVAGAGIWGGTVARWTGGGENVRDEGGNGGRHYGAKISSSSVTAELRKMV